MLERFLLATVATFSLSLLVHGIPQITAEPGQKLDVNANLVPSVDSKTQVAWFYDAP
jgi:hypothetical protein